MSYSILVYNQSVVDSWDIMYSHVAGMGFMFGLHAIMYSYVAVEGLTGRKFIGLCEVQL